MNKKLKNSAKIIAIAIEKYPNELVGLLTRNGIETSVPINKDELQLIVTTALVNSQTFRDEFANWCLATFNTNYANANGINYTFGSSIDNFMNPPKEFHLDIPKVGSDTSTSTTTTNENTKSGFFSGFTLNSGLGFVKDTLNSLATIKTASANEALANSVSIERVNENTAPAVQKSSTITYIVLGVLGISAIVGGIYFYNKSKK